MNWSAIHTNTVYSSGFELCLLQNLLCCERGVPGIWDWPHAMVSTCKSLELVSAFPLWLCTLTAFKGNVTYLFSLFFYVCLKLGIWLHFSDFKTSLKSMSCGYDEIWFFFIYKKSPHLSLITPAHSFMSPFIWLAKGGNSAYAHWQVDVPIGQQQPTFGKGRGTQLFPYLVSPSTILFKHQTGRNFYI